MSEISFDKLHSAQIKNSAVNSNTAKTASPNSQFAALLAEQLNEPLKEASENTAASSYSYSNSYNISNILGNTLGTIAAGSGSDSESTKNLVLMFYLMMCMNASSGDNSMSPLLMNLLANLNGESSGTNSVAGNTVTSQLLNLANINSVSPINSKGASIVQNALKRIGDPYSKSKRGSGSYVDCSYLAQWAYGQAGISIPSTSVSQAKYCYDNGYTITKAELMPGDLVFWSKPGCNCGRWNEIHHVGIYAGNNKVIEAKTSTGGVVLDDIWGENGKDWKIVMYARPF